MANWLRDFVLNFAVITTPLTDLTSKKKYFKWTPEAEIAFNQLKTALSGDLYLERPDINQPFILQTDTSEYGTGTFLFPGSVEDWKIIAYASTKLRPAERKYHINEKEY
ncbi:uncharacterized protein [Diabrotica undecimpunctata]|uniref:uncharacterized protein n=1 Tax=Diabrotica undecimpunctata TaxID=50387 RepID=UPI003B638CE3